MSAQSKAVLIHRHRHSVLQLNARQCTRVIIDNITETQSINIVANQTGSSLLCWQVRIRTWPKSKPAMPSSVFEETCECTTSSSTTRPIPCAASTRACSKPRAPCRKPMASNCQFNSTKKRSVSCGPFASAIQVLDQACAVMVCNTVSASPRKPRFC